MAGSLPKKKCFKVRVRTTSGLGDTSHTKIGVKSNDEYMSGQYFACERGVAYVFATDMCEVVELLGKGTVLSIDEVGPGYVAG